MTSKPERIAKELVKAKGEGVLELKLLNDFEKTANTRKIKERVNKFFRDSNAVTIEDGVWRVDEQYWELNPREVDNIWIAYELARTRTIVLWSITAALTFSFFIGLIIGLTVEIRLEQL